MGQHYVIEEEKFIINPTLQSIYDQIVVYIDDEEQTVKVDFHYSYDRQRFDRLKKQVENPSLLDYVEQYHDKKLEDCLTIEELKMLDNQVKRLQNNAIAKFKRNK